MDVNLLSFVNASEQRRKIIVCLEKMKTPSQIAHETKLSSAHVSRSLKEFCQKRIVRCETPDAKVGRIYSLTNKGKEILNHLKK